MAGYHEKPIARGAYGEASKIIEEVHEFMDAEDQGVRVMSLVELADLVGAIKGWLEENAGGITLQDLERMAEATGRAFLSGRRCAADITAPADPRTARDELHESNPIAINWTRLSQAVEYYRNLGFNLMEVPWLLPTWAVTATKEGLDATDPLLTRYGHLAGSAEQGFFALQAAGELPPGRRVAVSPCFRNEPVLDEAHRLWFIKAELHDTTGASPLELAKIAREGFAALLPDLEPEMHETPEGYDITLGGIEIGSYGEREVGRHHWVFGTAIAEPRLSLAAQMALAQKARAAEDWCHKGDVRISGARRETL